MNRPRLAGAARIVLGATLVTSLLSIPVAAPVAAAEPATFGEPRASSAFEQGISFEQPVELNGRPKRVEILVQLPGAPGPQAIEVETPGGTATSLQYRLPVSSGSILPNTRVAARWRVTAPDGAVSIGPRAAVTYADTRFDWRTRSGDLVRIHWYEGNEAFARRALEIGERAVRETSQLLGVTEKDPIDFFVYADKTSFYDILGPGSRENVGGQANAEIRTLFALIEPNEIDQPWVDIVVPHELTHLVFDTAVDNPYHFPPRWLNEGLAVYLSEGYGGDYRRAVEDAARDGSLIPLEGLTGQFPTTRDRFLLAYGESVSAVDYLIRTHSRDALVSLIKSYTRGLTDDEAFTQAIGVDTAAFDAAWRDDLDAKDPVAYGPKPAPAGPIPPGWSAGGQSGGNGGPAASGQPGESGAQAPTPAGRDSSSIYTIGLVAALAVVIIVVGAVVLGRRRKASP
jgi:hypothetical protein